MESLGTPPKQNDECENRYSARNFGNRTFTDVTKFRNAELTVVQSQTELTYFRG